MFMNKNDYIKYLKKIIKILESNNEIDENDYFFSQQIFEPFLFELLKNINKRLNDINNCCIKSRKDIINLLTYPGDNNSGNQHLKDWLDDCEKLIICDPFFFKHSYTKVYKNKKDYIESIKNILPKNLKEISVYYDKDKKDDTIYSEFKDFCKSNTIEFKNIETKEIHDRVWIKNDNNAKVVGTSFNGIGNKLAFILNLPKDDFEKFKSKLEEVSK